MGHVLSSTTNLPGLDVVLELVQAQTVGTTERLKPRTAEIPETHGFTTEDDFAGGRTHQVLAKTCRSHGGTDVCAETLVSHQEGETLSLRGLSVGWTPELGGVGGVVEPDEGRGDEAHEAQSTQAVTQVGLTIPDEGTTNPTEWLGGHMPDTAEDADQSKPDVATNDVLHGVHTNDPTFPAEGGTGEIAEDHTGIERRIGDQTHITTTWSPGVINAAEEHGLEDQQQATDTKKNQVITNDVGHLILVTPVLGEERGVVLEDFRSTQGVIKASQTKNSRADQVQDADHKEGEQIGDFTTGANAVPEGRNVRHADEALLIHGLVEGEVAHLKQHHCAGPEDHQTCVRHVGAEQSA